MLSHYHAVSIRHPSRCCQAVKQLDEQRFLSTEAPSLPLARCNLPSQCKCRYRHHTDRRDDARRDVDFGLPERMFFGPNRRERKAGRRASDFA
jgi:hypothetical protein